MTLHHHPCRISELAANLASLDIFQGAVVCTATRHQADWLKLELSQRLGSLAGVRFVRLEALIAPDDVPRSSRLGEERLAHLIRTLLTSGRVGSVSSWTMAAGQSPSQLARRHGQLSRKAARLLRIHALEDPDRLREWRSRRTEGRDPQSWLEDVFHELENEAGPTGSSVDGHFDVLTACWDSPASSLSDIHVFGVTRRPALSNEALVGRATHREVHVYGDPVETGVEVVSVSCHRTVTDEVRQIARTIWNECAGQLESGPARIRVVVPEARWDEYLAEIHAVFESARDLPFGVVGGPGAVNPHWDFLTRLIRAVEGGYLREDVVGVLGHAVSVAGHPGVDRGVLEDLAAEAGVIEGRDSSFYSGTDISGDLYHWAGGIKRLIRSSLGAPVSRPVELSGAVLPTVEFLVSRLTTVIESVDGWMARARPLGEWHRSLKAFLERYHGGLVPDGCGPVLDWFESNFGDDLEGRSVGFDEVADLIAGSEVSGNPEDAVTRPVVVCPPGSLTNCPCDLMFILGCSEGVVPAAPVPDRLDPLAGDPEGLLGRAEEILDAEVRSAGRVMLSRVRVDRVTGAEVPGSTWYRRRMADHGLEEDESSDCEVDGNMFPVLERSRRLAEETPGLSMDRLASADEALRSAMGLPRRTTRPGVPDVRSISLSAIHGFLCEPGVEWLKRSLELRAREARDPWSHREPFTVDGLGRAIVLSDFFSMNASQRADEVERLRLRARIPAGVPGGHFVSMIDGLLEGWHDKVDSLVSAHGDPVRYRFGPGPDATVTELSCQLALSGNPSLVGSSGFLFGTDRLLSLRSSKKVEPKHHLRNWMELVVLRAVGITVADDVESVIALADPGQSLDDVKARKRFHLPEPSACRKWLDDIVQEMISAPHPTALDLELSLKLWTDRDRSPASFTPGRRHLSDLHVRTQSFGVPADARELIERRIGAFLVDFTGTA